MQSNYLNITDSTLEDLVGLEEFEESLLMNILFMDRTVIHQANFFNSRNIILHMEKRPGFTSLFELAARNGLVVPSFHDPAVHSLEQALGGMRSKGMYGEDWMGEELKSKKGLVHRIIDSVDHGMKTHAPVHWPKDVVVGESYLGMLRKHLQTEDPPWFEGIDDVHADFLERIWEPTTQWRMDCIEEAHINTVRKGAKGVQRMEVIRSIGRTLGQTIEDNGNIRSHFHRVMSDGEERLRIDAFLRWLAQCHHLNMAQALDLSANFPLYHLQEDFMLDSLLSTPLDAPPPPTEHRFRKTVRFPSASELMQFSAQEVVAIRNDLGFGYLGALRAWNEQPSEANREAVAERFADYCEQLCARVESRGFTIDVEYSNDKRGQMKKLRDKGIETAAGLAPGVGQFAGLARFALAVYRYTKGTGRLRTGPDSKTLEISVLPPSSS